MAREFDNVDTGGAVMFTGRPWRGEEPLVNDWMDGAHVVADSAQAACELLDRLG